MLFDTFAKSVVSKTPLLASLNTEYFHLFGSRLVLPFWYWLTQVVL